MVKAYNESSLSIEHQGFSSFEYRTGAVFSRGASVFTKPLLLKNVSLQSQVRQPACKGGSKKELHLRTPQNKIAQSQTSRYLWLLTAFTSGIAGATSLIKPVITFEHLMHCFYVHLMNLCSENKIEENILEQSVCCLFYVTHLSRNFPLSSSTAVAEAHCLHAALSAQEGASLPIFIGAEFYTGSQHGLVPEGLIENAV